MEKYLKSVTLRFSPKRTTMIEGEAYFSGCEELDVHVLEETQEKADSALISMVERMIRREYNEDRLLKKFKNAGFKSMIDNRIKSKPDDLVVYVDF